MNGPASRTVSPPPGARRSDWPFFAGLGVFGGFYVVFILAVLYAVASFTGWKDLEAAIRSPEILFAIRLSLVSCTLTALLSLWVAVPAGYLLARFDFPGRRIVNAILDIPIVLPPLVIGLGLLILFQMPAGLALQRIVPVTYTIRAVVLAQFVVACAFSVRTMLVTFEQINPRTERVALTLGCSRAQAFWQVVLPEARRGILTAATLAWARSLGEFGPIMVFAGATRLRTEVLPTTVFLELSVGNIEAAAAVSLIMIVAALAVLALARMFGLGTASEGVL
jgi:molybdate transport system permease protein